MSDMTDSNEPDALLGRRLGKDGFLVILERLGEGGMGSVYVARDERRDRLLAIKFLHRECLADPDALARFKREGRKFSSLDHPHLVKVYGLGKELGRRFIISEFIKGRNLHQILEADGPLPADEALRICRDAADGLVAAHAEHIIHRDLKPENIMVREADGRVVVVDFGIAKDLDATTMLTAPGVYIGTIGYSAPEQIMGEEVDPRADIFSLGVILYELLTGRLAFDGSRTVEIREATLRNNPTPVRRLNDKIIAPLARLIDRMIQKKPRRRPRDMIEVVAAIDRVAAELRAGYTAADRRSIGGVLRRVFGA